MHCKWCRLVVVQVYLITLTGCLSYMPLITRDVGTVSANCHSDSTPFIVSLNNDNDREKNNNGQDRTRRQLVRDEDNLRHFRFPTLPGADKIKVLPPEDSASGDRVEPRRVRGWTAPTTAGQFDTARRFDFDAAHDLPLDLYLEGRQRSSDENNTVIKFIYYIGDPGDNDIACTSEFRGTVVNVTGELAAESRSSEFRNNRKILVGGEAQGEVNFRPGLQMTIQWNDENTGTFTPINANRTRYNAPASVTRIKDSNEAIVSLQIYGLVIEAHRLLNITSPEHASVDSQSRFPVESRLLDANDGVFTLFRDKRITYDILDQFNEEISESAGGGRVVQIRENIGNVMTSSIPAVQAWIQNGLSWTNNWIDKSEGRFTDGLNAFDISKEHIRIRNVNAMGQVLQTWQFHTDLQTGTNANPTGIMMRADHHRWEVSVNGNRVRPITDNSFIVRVSHMQGNPVNQGGLGRKIRLRSEYTVNVQ